MRIWVRVKVHEGLGCAIGTVGIPVRVDRWPAGVVGGPESLSPRPARGAAAAWRRGLHPLTRKVVLSPTVATGAAFGRLGLVLKVGERHEVLAALAELHNRLRGLAKPELLVAYFAHVLVLSGDDALLGAVRLAAHDAGAGVGLG